MSENIDSTMNLKLNNELQNSVNLLQAEVPATVKEERQRTGRYIAILVGISLFLLALYHAWVRRIPVIASLVVPALIMFVYVGWVLYTASRDKKRRAAADAEAALNAIAQENAENDERTSVESPEESVPPVWSELSSVFLKGDVKPEEKPVCFVKPIILINDKLPEDSDQKWTTIVESFNNNEKIKGYPTRRRFKRKFCRKRRNSVFKRSYSIG